MINLNVHIITNYHHYQIWVIVVINIYYILISFDKTCSFFQFTEIVDIKRFILSKLYKNKYLFSSFKVDQ